MKSGTFVLHIASYKASEDMKVRNAMAFHMCGPDKGSVSLGKFKISHQNFSEVFSFTRDSREIMRRFLELLTFLFVSDARQTCTNWLQHVPM